MLCVSKALFCNAISDLVLDRGFYHLRQSANVFSCVYRCGVFLCFGCFVLKVQMMRTRRSIPISYSRLRYHRNVGILS